MPERKSNKALKTRGTYRPDRHGPAKTSGETVTILPDPPLELDDLAMQFWHAIGSGLVTAGRLKDTDLFTLAAYCREAAIYEHCSRMAGQQLIETLANGVTTVSHWRRAAQEALQAMTRLSDRLGLSPRARLTFQGEDAPRKPVDPLAQLFQDAKNPGPMGLIAKGKLLNEPKPGKTGGSIASGPN